VACVLERMLPLAYEVSVIVARGASGEVVHFPLQQNLHRDGILAVTQVPAPDVTPAVQQRAIAAAEKIAATLGYVGVLCVEFFVLKDGSLVANEMAPRPHASAVMLNLLGDLCFAQGDAETSPPWDAVMALPGAHLHLYGKASARRGRKMGHLTFTAATPQQARSVALQAASLLGLAAW
jgi:5-(carboxyamino)imidazole ribonucleotide synthase